MITEEEAWKKWCPFARWPLLSDGEEDKPVITNIAVNRVASCDSHCIASKCMAWRAGEIERIDNSTGDRYYDPAGFCGLAGKENA